jgi:cell fate regulator YaaT (PSP1 superfamily)
MCGRAFCCSTFLGDFQPVSIKMAKEQGLSLNPVKISGTCGRLMCCLKYEQNAYEHLLKITPKQGAIVDTADGRGVVTEVSLLTGRLRVRLERQQEGVPTYFHRDDVKIVKDVPIRVARAEIEALKHIE